MVPPSLAIATWKLTLVRVEDLSKTNPKTLFLSLIFKFLFLKFFASSKISRTSSVVMSKLDKKQQKLFDGKFNKNLFNHEFEKYKRDQQKKSGMQLVKYDNPTIKQVRGKGLLVGLCLHKDQTNFVKKLLENNLLSVRAAENVVRLLPPLNVTKAEINLGLKIIDKVCKNYR